MSENAAYKTLDLTVHFSDDLPEEQEQFWEALEWVRRHFADALKIHIHLLGTLREDTPTLPVTGGALLLVVSKEGLMAAANPADPTEHLFKSAVDRAADEPKNDAPALQVMLFFEGLTPDQSLGGQPLDGRLLLKKDLAAEPHILLETFDRADEFKRQMVEDLMGLCERFSRGVSRHKQPVRVVQYPEDLLHAIRPVKVEIDAATLKMDKAGAAMMAAGNAVALSMEGHWVEAELSFLEALSLNEDRTVLKAWGHYLMQVHRFALAAQVWRQVIHESQEAGDRTAEAEGFYQLALSHQRRGQTEVAIVEAKEAVEHFNTLGSTALKASAHLLLGDLLVKTHRQKEAQKIYDAAMGIYAALQNTQEQAQVCLKKGQAHQQLEELPEAEASYHKALQILEKTKNVRPQVLARAYIQKGSLDSQRRMYAMAERSYERAAEIFQKLDDIEGLSDITSYLARTALLKGQADKSLLLLRCALALDSALEDYEGLGMNHLSMGVLRGQTGDRNESLRHLKAAKALFELAGAVSKQTIAEHMVALLEKPE